MKRSPLRKAATRRTASASERLQDRNRKQRRNFFLERLEDRSLMATLYWQGAAGGNVSSPTNLTGQLNPGGTPLITNISSFAEDLSGEIYILDIGSGQIFKIIAVPEPASLAALGLGAAGLWMRRLRRK